jgi:hypothetical protein
VAGVAIVIVGVVVLGGTYHPVAGSSTETIAPVGWSATSLPYGQFGDVPFITDSTENITGAFETANTISVYLMTAAQFASLVKDAILSGYEWTSGQVWNGTISYTLPAGEWDLVFLNTNPYGSSGVAITTAVVLTKA